MKKKSRLATFFHSIGPGFITGASDDDPSGIATYSQTGAQFGYGQLWLALFTTPFMIVVQEMCGRLGLVSGKGLGKIILERYGKRMLFFAVALLTIANIINIGADLGAIASSMQLILNLPFVVWLVVFTLLILSLEVFVPYKKYAKWLKFFTLSLFAYVIAAVLVTKNWSQVGAVTFIPHFSFSREYILNIVAILGTTFSPYLFFWQADEEVEEEKAHHKLVHGISKFTSSDIRHMRLDTALGMIFSNLIMFFIIVTAASTLMPQGITSVETATQAAQALRPVAGAFASLIFALGIIGTGLLAVPVLAGSASYAIAQGMNWRAGLALKAHRAKGFYGVMALAMLIGFCINFTPIKPFQMLYYTAILNGLLAPPLMIIILFLARDKKVVGEHRTPLWMHLLGWIIALVMAGAAVLFFVG